MRKKQLEDELTRLISRNNELYSDNIALAKDVGEKKKLIAELSAQISELNEKIAELTESITTTEPAIVSETVKQNTSGDSAGENDAVPTKTVETTASCNSRLEYASSIIGKAVLLSADICNEFADYGGSNAKDLINLALGRTEVFKSEVLDAISGKQMNASDLTLDDLLTQFKDYLDLLRKQII